MDTTVNFIVTLVLVLLLAKGLDKLGLLSLFRESGSEYRRRRARERAELDYQFDETVRRNNSR
ncbi:hypothetical protein [Burkholderia gladioli]|uniref:hypothetical protein n=1 Tax=Burkholderia gladioli TaxID=28095 RepID=UPI000BBD192F|nr:hypothetical protein [Burkholderia gladioli]ATF90513.1 hypothetical protein CO712_36115 [Burkholderia gladioli pv. gladioli]MBJ9711309.1 hypothetical protein [Burkholderia gladioli]MDN7499583.1 hypothetical protein [Burkholderia gladioli]MDR8086155.1 hypothetical protein [Burkholderia gladioli]MDZ4041457.1 hypothetical protein [Burkholderia gladioli pv. alliicola]